jgi:hypothetical protein
MIFSTRIDVQIGTYQGLIKTNDYPQSMAYVDIDAPDFDGAIFDMKKLCKQIADAHLQRLAETNYHPDFGTQRISITVSGKIAGFEERQYAHLDEKLYNQLKAERTSAEKMNQKTDLASLQNDIEYGINMIESVTPDLAKNIQMIGVVNWQWHILNKHFGLVIPQAIQDLAANYGKTDGNKNE